MRMRVISAVIAASLLIGAYVFGRTQGLYVVSVLVMSGALFEYSRLAFARHKENVPLMVRAVFIIASYAVYASCVWMSGAILPVFALAGVFFLSVSLLTVHQKEDLETVHHTWGSGLFGFFYAAICPGLATKLLQFDDGSYWLIGLLAIVFSGDTFAYLTGRAFGKSKLLEVVSPKKTLEGAAGGVLGSALAAGALWLGWLGKYPLGALIGLAIVTGIFAQLGDLVESLLKRVADVKDSGSIMPGHGGVLDRVDGVYFAAPIYFLMVSYLVN